MTSLDFSPLNLYLADWRGADAFFNRYFDDDEVFILGLRSRKEPLKSVGISFTLCTFVSGPFRWSNAHLVCEQRQASLSGVKTTEIRDAANGFVLRFNGPIVVGNGELIISPSA